MNSCLNPAIRWREPRCLWKPGARLPASLSPHPRFRWQQRRRVHPRPGLRAMPGRQVQVSFLLRRGLGRLFPAAGGDAGRHFHQGVAAAMDVTPEFRRELRGFRRGRWNVCFGYADWSRRCDGFGGIVIGGLKRGLGRLALTGFRILFGALETIAHPLAHVRFVTQLHSAGNPAQGKRTKAASLGVAVLWPRATPPA
jgi:hypothetical protein